jgi:hypothetical protein
VALDDLDLYFGVESVVLVIAGIASNIVELVTKLRAGII